MEQILKKFSAMLLAVLMLVSAILVAIPPEGLDLGVKAEAAGNVNFGGVSVYLDYGPGDYFTDDGSACTDHGIKGIHSTTDESACNCKCSYNGTVLGACQCFGYARYIQMKLFGKNSYSNSGSFYKVSGTSVPAGSLTAEKIKNIMLSEEIKPGAHIRTNEGTESKHSLVVTNITDTGFSIIQANGSNNNEYSTHMKCRIGTFTYTWSSYASSTYGLRGIEYIEMPTVYQFVTGSTPSTPEEPEVEESYADVGDDFYAYIINTELWKHLTNDEANVSIRSETGNANQIWYFDRQDDGSYSIFSALNGTCLEVNNFDAEEGANVQTYWYSGNAAQQWYIDGDSAQFVFKAKCTECVMDVTNGSSTEGTNIQMWEYNGTGSQLFQIWKLDDYLMVPNVTSECEEYVYGRDVKLVWSDVLGAEGYWINVYKDEECILSENLGDVSTYLLTNLKDGQYKVYIEAYTSSENWKTSIGSHSFTVNPLSATTVRSDKEVYLVGDEVTLSWDVVEGATGYWIDIYRNDEGIYSSGVERNYKFLPLPGEYTVFVSSISDAIDWVSVVSTAYTFVVKDIEPVQVYSDNNIYEYGNDVTLNWNPTEGASSYYIDIWKDGVGVVSESVGTNTSYTFTPSPGEYDVYVSSSQMISGCAAVVSPVYKFVVNNICPPVLSIDKESYFVGDNIIFVWEPVQKATGYDLVLQAGASCESFHYDSYPGSISMLLPAGSYSASVVVYCDGASNQSEWVNFEVLEIQTDPIPDPEPTVYDLTPNINGGASKLYEPWGLRYFAVYEGADVDKVTDRGIAILKDKYYSSDMTAEEFVANANAYIFLDSAGELGYDTASGRYYATLTEGIYSYDIGAYYYVLPFAVMENGSVVYGTIKRNSMENILNTNLKLTSITKEEKAICTCILKLKESVADHYAATGVPGASIDMDIPRGDTQNDARDIYTMEESGVVPNIVAGASRLIEPWGLRYFAAYSDGEGGLSIGTRGIVILGEKYYSSAYANDPEQMRLNPNSYVYRDIDGTLLCEESTGRYYATLTEGISSKDIADVYYVVPFVVLDDGSYVYGTVKQNSMMKIMKTNLNIASVPATEKQVSRDIIALYEAVKAYYE